MHVHLNLLSEMAGQRNSVQLLMQFFIFLIMNRNMNCLLTILQTSQAVPVRVLPQVHEKHKHPYAPHGKVPCHQLYVFPPLTLVTSFPEIHYQYYPDLLPFRARSSVGRASENLIRRSWVQAPPRSSFLWPIGTPKFP